MMDQQVQLFSALPFALADDPLKRLGAVVEEVASLLRRRWQLFEWQGLPLLFFFLFGLLEVDFVGVQSWRLLCYQL